MYLYRPVWYLGISTFSNIYHIPEFSDNPGIAALWQDEKARREWKDLTDDLIAPPSPGVTLL